MDNPETGDVSFEANGKTYVLRYTTAAFVALEAYLDRGIIDIYEELSTWSPPFDPEKKVALAETPQQILARVKKMRLGFMRAVFWAGFHDRHRDVTIDQAGELMESIGGMMVAYKLVVEGVSHSHARGQEGAARPPKGPSGRRRTGSVS